MKKEDEAAVWRRERLLDLAKGIAILATDPSSVTYKQHHALACAMANTIRGEFGFYCAMWTPEDVTGDISHAGELDSLTYDECLEVLGRISDYDHIYTDIQDAIDDAAKDVLSEREEGGSK